MPAVVVVHSRRVVSGAGAVAALPAELAEAGITRALIVGGRSVLGGPVGEAVRRSAGTVAVGQFDRCRANAPLDVVDALAGLAREAGADGLVSVGGGSAHDTAKGASVLLGIGGRLIDHATTFDPPDRQIVPDLAGPRLPVIAVPTTFSAAEATASAGFLDAGQRRKVVVVDRSAPVRAVVLDPELIAVTPRGILAASAGNALNHCVEALYSRGHSPVTDAYALHALRTLVSSVEAALAGDIAALAACQAAAYLSGLAMPAAGLGVSHALCHVLGVFGADHGAANSAVLTHGIVFNAAHARDRLELMERELGIAAGQLAPTIAELLRRTGAPVGLREVGVAKDDLPAVARRALSDRHLYANPRPVRDAADLEQLLLEAW